MVTVLDPPPGSLVRRRTAKADPPAAANQELIDGVWLSQGDIAAGRRGSER
jgi:hypothetical protein